MQLDPNAASPLSAMFQRIGDVVPLPIYPGSDATNRLFIENLKNRLQQSNPGVSPDKMNRAFDGYFGGGAQILPFPGAR